MNVSKNKIQTLVVQANTVIAAFGAILPAIDGAGKLDPTEVANLKDYVNTSTAALQTVVSELQDGTSLSEISTVIQTIVAAYDSVAAGLTPGIALWVNVANVGVQGLLASVQAEIGTRAGGRRPDESEDDRRRRVPPVVEVRRPNLNRALTDLQRLIHGTTNRTRILERRSGLRRSPVVNRPNRVSRIPRGPRPPVIRGRKGR